jgi:accessory colonization factor AcfC
MFRSFKAIVFNRLEQKLRILLTQMVLFFSVQNVQNAVRRCGIIVDKGNFQNILNLLVEILEKKLCFGIFSWNQKKDS